MGNEKKVIVIAGPSGSGESTITGELLRLFPNSMRRLVTATTRAPREGEQEGVDYHFFSKERFSKERESGNIIEETYVANRDTYYGSYKPDLDAKLAAGFIVIINPDIVGARYYAEHYGAASIFIMPGDIEELFSRIKNRNPGISEHELAQRRENAQHEIDTEQSFYSHTIINADGKLEQAVESIIEVLKKDGYKLV